MGASTRCSCATIAGIASVTIVPAILRPFPNVAMDVIETPRVWLEAVDRHRASTILALGAAALIGVDTAIIVGLLGRDRGPPPERRRRAGARHVLALGL